MTRPIVKKLRANPTEAEKALWQRVRAKQLGYRFRRQYPLGPYVVDFICLQRRLIVELDGGQHTPEADSMRTAWLEAQGFAMLRFWNNDILENMDGVLTTILTRLAPPPLAGGGREEGAAPRASSDGTFERDNPLLQTSSREGRRL